MDRRLQAAGPYPCTEMDYGFKKLRTGSSVRERIVSWVRTVRNRMEERRARELMGKFLSNNRDIMDDLISDQQFYLTHDSAGNRNYSWKSGKMI